MTLAEEKISKNVLNRLQHFEDCAHAIDQLFHTALAKQGDNAFDEFVGFASRFSNLSVYNAMLVRLQRPGAAMVGSRRQWRVIGREVLPDAIPIVILWPFGPVQFLFELNDTYGEPLPGHDQNPLLAHGSITVIEYQRTKQAAAGYGIEVVETDQYGDLLAGTAAGFSICPERLSGSKELAFRVKLNAKHKLPSRFATLAHELGHIYCGHLGADSKGRWPARRFSQKAEELEAEAVAWLVCQRNDITTRSAEYLSSLVNEVDLEEISMYSIYEAANRVESRTAGRPLK